MLHQPFIYILFASILLALTTRYSSIFRTISIMYPFFAFVSLIMSNGVVEFEILGVRFLMDYQSDLKIVGYSFLIASLAFNAYLVDQNKKLEIIIGGFYLAFSSICLFAADFISMIISLELMMICATVLIFAKGSLKSAIAAKQYFLTHLFSGSLILVGTCYYINQSGSTSIVNLNGIQSLSWQSNFIYGCMLTGCLINIAALPFTSWMINCYQKSTSGGFLYLTTFSTKISIIMILKLFLGFEILKYFGVSMMLYGTIYACFENNLRRLFCYLSIAQIGFMLIAIGTNIDSEVISYLAVHILYKGLLGMSFVILNDFYAIKDYTQFRLPKLFMLNIGLILSLLMLINLPMSVSFISKLVITANIQDIYIQTALQLMNILIFLALPIKQGIQRNLFTYSETNIIPVKSLLIFIISLSWISWDFTYDFFQLSNFNAEILNKNLLKQVITIIIGILAALLIKLPKTDTRKFNFDVLVFVSNYSSYLMNIYRKFKNIPKEVSGFNLVEDKIFKNLTITHSQSLAIGIIFFMLMILILTQIKG